MILVDRSDTGNGNFDIYFNYDSIQWETGNADGGRDGSGGNSAAAGFSNGAEVNPQYFQFAGSQVNGALLDGGSNSLAGHTNDDVTGQYVFQVRNGQVTGGGSTPPPPQHAVSFGASIESKDEGDSGGTPFLVTITRSGDHLDAASTVDWRLQADEADDLSPNQALTGQVTFAPGQTTATFNILVQGDTVYEQDEFVQIHLTHETFGGDSWESDDVGTGIILNDDARTTFTFAEPVLLPEGNFGSTEFDFVVNRGGDVSHASTVQWTLTPNTADSADFAAGQPMSGTLTFAAGQTSATIEIQVAGDRTVEPDETFTVNLVQATNQTGDGAVTVQLHNNTDLGTIVDDDARRTVLVGSPMTLTAPEGDSGLTAFNFTVMRVGDTSATADIAYAIALPAGGLSASEIATPLTGQVHFAAGAWQSVLTVQVQGDTIPEPDESFQVSLGGSGGYNLLTLTGVVMNDDKVATTAGAASSSGISADAEVSSFMQHLVGGGLWNGDLM